MVDEQSVKDGQEWYIKQEIEPEDRQGIEHYEVIEQCQRNEGSVYRRNQGKWAYACPFPFGREVDSSNAVANDDGSDKAIKDG